MNPVEATLRRRRPSPLLPLALTTAVAALGTSIANVALPEVSGHFEVSVATTQWVTLSYLITTTISVVLMGRLADAYGRSRVLIVGVAVFALAALVAGLAPSLGLLVAARAVQGIGAAAMTVIPVALIKENIPAAKTGQAMGLIGSSMATGMALGPAVGGLLIGVADWRAPLLVMAPLGLLAGVLVHLIIPVSSPAATARFSLNPGGLILMATALSAYTIAISLQPGGWAGTLALLLLAVAATALFIRNQNRSAGPLIQIGLIRRINVVPQFVMTFLGALIMMNFLTVAPFYLTRGLDLDSSLMGITLAVGPMVAILAGVPAGRLVDKRGPRAVTLAGLALMTLASLVFTTVTPLLGVAGFLLAAVLLTPGNQLFMAANNAATMSRADAAAQGAVSGLLNLFRNLGTITGAGLTAVLFDGAADATSGLRAVFLLAAVAGALGVAFALRELRSGV